MEWDERERERNTLSIKIILGLYILYINELIESIYIIVTNYLIILLSLIAYLGLAA